MSTTHFLLISPSTTLSLSDCIFCLTQISESISSLHHRHHFQALVLSKITYALTPFSVTFKCKVNIFRKTHCRGLLATVFELTELHKHDSQLFLSVAFLEHCLHYLLPEKQLFVRSTNLGTPLLTQLEKTFVCYHCDTLSMYCVFFVC